MPSETYRARVEGEDVEDEMLMEVDPAELLVLRKALESFLSDTAQMDIEEDPIQAMATRRCARSLIERVTTLLHVKSLEDA